MLKEVKFTMSRKVLDAKGRWRNKVVAFRMSSNEDKTLERLVALSGLSKQEYLINRVLQKDIVVRPNPYVHKCISKQLNYFISLLEKQSFNEMNGDDKEIMCFMLKIISELKGDYLDA